MVDILLQKSTLTATNYVETVALGVKYVKSTQPMTSVRPFSYMITSVPNKARVTVTFLKEQTSRFCPPNPPPKSRLVSM